MKNLFYFIIIAILFASCSKTEVLPPDYYDQELSYNDSSDSHPNALEYQNILDDNQKLGAVGISVMIKDRHGIWLGTSGKADIANDVDLHPSHSMYIASITKVFTASLVYKLIENGKLSLDDYVSDWISEDVIKGVANAVEHLS